MFNNQRNESFKVPVEWVAEHRIQVLKDALEIAQIAEKSLQIVSVINEEFDLAA